MKASWFITPVLACGALFLALGCTHSTQVQQSWKDPELKEIRYEKFLAVALTADGASRRNAEQALAEALPGTVVPGYQYIADAESLKQPGQVRSAIQASGADALVTLRFVSRREELDYVPGAPVPSTYVGFHSYWGRVNTPRTVYVQTMEPVQRTYVLIETNIYDAKTEKLVWSGTTETANPSKMDKLIQDTVDALKREMVKQGLIPAPAK